MKGPPALPLQMQGVEHLVLPNPPRPHRRLPPHHQHLRLSLSSLRNPSPVRGASPRSSSPTSSCSGASTSGPASPNGCTSPKTPKSAKSVTFKEVVAVSPTWDKFEYDRTGTEKSDISRDELMELLRLRKEYQKHTARLHQAREHQQRLSHQSFHPIPSPYHQQQPTYRNPRPPSPIQTRFDQVSALPPGFLQAYFPDTPAPWHAPSNVPRINIEASSSIPTPPSSSSSGSPIPSTSSPRSVAAPAIQLGAYIPLPPPDRPPTW